MALFNRRKKDEEVLPAEVREYYQTERRERAGLAWLLAIGTLIVTFLIAAGLFFGGRWVYRTVFDNDDKNNTTGQGLSVDEAGNVEGTEPATTGTPSNPATTPTPNTATSSTSTSTPSPSGGTTAGTSTATPSTGPSELADTGTGDLLAIAAAVAVVGAMTHHVVLAERRR